jgi:hypothetical protein
VGYVERLGTGGRAGRRGPKRARFQSAVGGNAAWLRGRQTGPRLRPQFIGRKGLVWLLMLYVAGAPERAPA